MGSDASTGDRIEWLTLDGPLRDSLESAIATTLGSHAWVDAAYLYGSLAIPGGTGRDIDIGLAVSRPPADHRLLDAIAEQISTLTGIAPEKLDIRILDTSNPVLLGEVLGKGRRIYEASTENRIRFEALAHSVWLDFKPIWTRMRQEMLERSSRG
jgi:predicted nucleotidyltransferase